MTDFFLQTIYVFILIDLIKTVKKLNCCSYFCDTFNCWTLMILGWWLGITYSKLSLNIPIIAQFLFMRPRFGTGVLLFKGPVTLGRWMQHIGTTAQTAGLLNISRLSHKEWIKIPMIYRNWCISFALYKWKQHVDLSSPKETILLTSL